MSFDEGKDVMSPVAEDKVTGAASAEALNRGHQRQMSEASCYETEGEEDEVTYKSFQLGPQLTLKEQLEKDKDDESLRRWKEQLIGSVDLDSVGDNLEADVKIVSISILSPGRSELVLPLPEVSRRKALWFTLKEGTRYSIKFSFLVSNNIVSGLIYSNTVWKTGVKLEAKKVMIGTFGPQPEPYIHETAEDTAPSGMLARGSYSARIKFMDDDNKCYLKIKYTFDIRKEWASD
ncbi:hypothetical protein MRB53_030035 [Persea americana]|uniref:Uncharacterized protein n=1 Tax=Persea americana TaxID=3435 RepID=A0ACC2KK19_PERAE|nr:hypothetical protein MRB53_030035 [Persea americana]|eukprot:TRINITY_DN6888_c0_g1_i5.p1 TRINITY_DN6888_c0_g1~~TRINITY_DN6888_c0_g1_i5.p1  ORF type:complete len:234 (-),score=56.73 TRINITY_DN6888_c0_g1_i5:223-924(-)